VKPEYLLDASALLALIRTEPGASWVIDILDRSQIHAVNLAEVVRKLFREGATVEEVLRTRELLNLDVTRELLNLDVIEELTGLNRIGSACWRPSTEPPVCRSAMRSACLWPRGET
jgi:PIN domain nuclease of toxin-antitoxin system